MTTRIALLHTAASNAAAFGAAAPPGASLSHALRGDLLAEAERRGGLDDGIAGETTAALSRLARSREADAVLLTCSSLGPSVARVRDAPVPVLRVDAALAERAVRGGGRVVVLCAVSTTVAPTGALFEAAARATGATAETRLVPGAWDAFRAGDAARYAALVADAAEVAYAEGAGEVALAQASMAGAAAVCASRGGRVPLTSPEAGLAAAVAAATAAADPR